MATEQDYLELGNRLNKLMQQHAVLSSQEDQKAVRRDELRKKLTEAGINPDDPEGEISRLEKEAEDAYAETKAKIDTFEAALKSPQEATPPDMPVEKASEEPETGNQKPDGSLAVDDIDI